MDTPSKHPGRSSVAIGSAAIVLTVALGIGAGTALRDVLPAETEEPADETTAPQPSVTAPTPSADAGVSATTATPAENPPGVNTPVVAPPETPNTVATVHHRPPPQPSTRIAQTPQPRRPIRLRTRSS